MFHLSEGEWVGVLIMSLLVLLIWAFNNWDNNR